MGRAFPNPSCSLASGNGAPGQTGPVSSSEAILSSVVLFDDGLGSAQQCDGLLGSGSGVGLVRSSLRPMVNGEPFLTSTHSTKVAEYFRGPTPDSSVVK